MCNTCEAMIEAMNANALVEDLTKRNVTGEEMNKARSRASLAAMGMQVRLKQDLTKAPGEQFSIYKPGEYARESNERLRSMGLDRSKKR